MKSLAESSPRRVESRQNARVKELRAGLSRGMKTAHDHIAVEGLHLVQEAVKSGLKLDTVFLLEGHEELAQQFPLADAEVLILSEDVFSSAAMTEHPQGVAALVEAPQFEHASHVPGCSRAGSPGGHRRRSAGSGKPRHPGSLGGSLWRHRHDPASRHGEPVECEDFARILRIRLPLAGSRPGRRRRVSTLCATTGCGSSQP